MGMEIVTGSTGAAHVTPVDDAVRNGNSGYLNDNSVFDVYDKFAATIRTSNLVRIGSGYGMMQGRLFKISELDYEDLIIDNGSQGVKRCDLICARYSMSQQTGYEKIELVVLKGDSGQSYVKPQTLSGNINGETKQADFPLYEVHINGITLESCTALFTPLPDGGRIGLIEKDLKEHKESSDPHKITFVDTGAGNVENIVSRESFSNIFKKIATAIKALTDHIANKQNPHSVKGSQLADAVPISKGGTGATTKAGALANLGIPSNVSDSMAKSVYDSRIDNAPINYAISVNEHTSGVNVECNSQTGIFNVTSKELKGGSDDLMVASGIPEGQYKAIVQVAHSEGYGWTHRNIGSGIFYWIVTADTDNRSWSEIKAANMIASHDITTNPSFDVPKDGIAYIVYKNDNNGSISFEKNDKIRMMIVKATANADGVDLFDDNIYNYRARNITLREDIQDMKASFQNGVDTIKNAITAKNVTPTASTPSALATAVGAVYTKGQTDAQAVSWTKDVTIRAYNSSVAEAEYDITNVTKIKCISGTAYFSANITTVSGRQQIAGGYHLAVGDECDMTRANKDIPTTANNTVEVATNSSAKIRFTYVARKRL